MERKEILRILGEYKKEYAAEYGILALGVFGSVARNEALAESDIDVDVRIAKPDLFLLVGLKTELEKRLHKPVDIVAYRENRNQFLKKRIDGEAIYA
jgi:uncharacterized protein